ncbi:EH signature domain-containing protein [Polaribacter sp. 11A2H]|uniref:EH signature domain-containing protein n=1 Tax=Polaribacter sp. 11A2H TaxID=2687290 RepID=UPI00140D69E5|nr:EH signature domain-containing protein [Polaribacter sp. 11A2H]
MENIKQLLNWNLLNSAFKTNGQKLIAHKTKEIFNSNIDTLGNIALQQTMRSELPKQELVEEIYDKFKNLEALPIAVLLESFTKREVRLLVWSLDYKGEDSILFGTHFSKFISLVIEYWRDSYIIPLWFVLLKNWEALNNNKARFQEYLVLFEKKCNEYEKSRKDVLAIKTHFNFWQPKGISSFVNYLNKNNIQFNAICTSLNFNTNILGTDYYYESFILYLKTIDKKDISKELVESVLVEIKGVNRKKYKLILLSILITYGKFSKTINTIQQAAFSTIGDPIVKRHWLSGHLNEEEIELVESARKKLLILMNKKFIKIFFSKLVQDPRREKYWLKFIDDIEDVKFVGNRLNYSILKNNQEISKYVDARYTITRSNQSTSALIFWARDYVFVEFSDTGAVYIYKKENFNIKTKHIEKITDLKSWPRGMAVIKSVGNYWEFMPEGTHAHMGENWELRLNIWMKKYFYN